MSDTHDNMAKIRSAVELFNSHEVEVVLHCGDFVAPFALLPFRELKCGKFYGVFGNNDGEKNGLKSVAYTNRWDVGEQPKILELDGKKIAIVHEPHRADGLPNLGSYDVILHGHTHKEKAQKDGECLIINPGEGGGWVTGRATVAVLDTASLNVEFHSI